MQQLQLRPVAAYFLGAGLLFLGILAVWGLNRRATILALASTYSNLVMIGVPLVGLAYGQAGLVTLFTLISLHALVLLTLATVALELALAREQVQLGGTAPRHPLASVGLAVRNAVIHPVPLPIIVGLLFAQTGWALPPWVDQPLHWLGLAFGPLALLLVGVTLAHARIGGQWRAALGLALAKNLLLPALVLAGGWLLGLAPAALTVMVVAAALPNRGQRVPVLAALRCGPAADHRQRGGVQCAGPGHAVAGDGVAQLLVWLARISRRAGRMHGNCPGLAPSMTFPGKSLAMSRSRLAATLMRGLVLLSFAAGFAAAGGQAGVTTNVTPPRRRPHGCTDCRITSLGPGGRGTAPPQGRAGAVRRRRARLCPHRR